MAPVLVNGQRDDSLSVHDRGLHYGDGVFETIAVSNGQALCWEQHIRRLTLGCETLGIHCPSAALLKEEADRLCLHSHKRVVKIIISRGPGGRGYRPPHPCEPTRIIALYDWPDYPSRYWTDGITAAVCQIRLGHNPLLAGIKHLNRLEQVLLRNELALQDSPEGIVLDITDHVIEGTMSNIFWVKDNVLYTPDLGQCGIAGIIRAMILEIAADLPLQTHVDTLTLEHIYDATEVFFCNSIIGLWPVIQIERKRFQPGECTDRLRQRLLSNGAIIAS
ncbi:MAG: aminodeoxychorismate lyase [Gammaproteobacteria bacterium]